MRDLARRTVVVLGLVAAIFVLTAPARAHDPIFLGDDQTDPGTGPLLPDGTISFAIYGTLDAAGDTRGFQVEFAAGDRLFVELLIPDLAPENGLATGDLPIVTITAPDGAATALSPDLRVPFFEPFSGTSYVRLASLDQPAQQGTYDVAVTGSAAARFTVAIGTQERFGTPVERVADRTWRLDEWYAAPPAAAEPAGWGGSRVLLAGAAALALGGPFLLRSVRRRAQRQAASQRQSDLPR